MGKVLLLLEGGAMRGNYTAGILDYCIDQNLVFEDIMAVSAGLCNALNYKAWQKGRTISVNKQFCQDKRYISFRSFLKNRQLINLDFLFNTISRELLPFDFEKYKQSNINITTVLSEANMEEPFYKKMGDISLELEYAMGACSMPILSKFVEVDGYKLLDGGAVDAIPIEKALAEGYDKFVIVLTRPKGYVKEKSVIDKLMQFHYHDYPKMVELFRRKNDKYNRSLEIISRLEKEEKAFVFYPSKDLKVKRAERNPEKLEAIYQLGIKDIKEKYDKLQEFLEK